MDNKSKKIILCLSLISIILSSTIVLSRPKEEVNLGDIVTKEIAFNEKTIEDKQIVLFDNESNYARYLVYTFTNDESFVAYSYEYLRNVDEYYSVYAEHNSDVVYYDFDNLMLKIKIDGGAATYSEVFDNYRTLINTEKYSIVY